MRGKPLLTLCSSWFPISETACHCCAWSCGTSWRQQILPYKYIRQLDKGTMDGPDGAFFLYGTPVVQHFWLYNHTQGICRGHSSLPYASPHELQVHLWRALKEHLSHLNFICFSQTDLSAWFLSKCLWKCGFEAVWKSHLLHLNGFSLVWDTICVWSWEMLGKAFEYKGHVLVWLCLILCKGSTFLRTVDRSNLGQWAYRGTHKTFDSH